MCTRGFLATNAGMSDRKQVTHLYKNGCKCRYEFSYFLWKMKSVYTNVGTLNGPFALCKIHNGVFKVDKFLDEYSTLATSASQQITLNISESFTLSFVTKYVYRTITQLAVLVPPVEI
jgi:hypothetical protein